ncbi:MULTISPECIES: glycosyltransferase family 2 protein [Blautia]|uniref:Glycosyltransferase 2-like domain-containing protein n=1 Tax=Blautia argi TaxID=1912897 RepID=A0A2Z4UCB6_9FIRM|nr:MULTISPECIES: glycosyltransferase [Blautia]AWY98504.1 hypothetical protein DQQ01_10480 [Blautia argi]
MAQPLVSVLIPVYNVEEYLERCLDSVLNQSLTRIEVICVNDGSTDKSLEILKKYQENDSRVIIVSKENGGLPSARNAGIERARGEYIGFVDSDDYVQPDMFEKLYNTAKKEKSDVVVCGANILPETPRASDWLYACLSPGYRKYDKFDANMLFHDMTVTPFLWRTLIKKSLIDKYNLRLNETIMIGEDKAFQCKVYPLAESITVIPDKLYNYFWCREGSLMNQTVYGDPEKKVLEHGRLIADIAETVMKYQEKEHIKEAFLEWSIPFLYDDFIFLSLENKVDLATKMIDVWNKCGYPEYKFDMPEWKREMVDYFEQVAQEEKIIPRLSLVIPVDIEAEYLEETIANILEQSLEEMEILLVNNGTKNENYAILHKYLFKDKRIRLLNIAHTSYAEALNRGMNLARAKYITFMETYDWYENKSSLKEWIEYTESENVDVCGSMYCMKNVPGALAGEYRSISNPEENIGKYLESDFHSMIFRTEYLRKNEILFHESTILTGFEFLAFACLHTERRAWYQNITYIHRNIHRPDWISTEKCKIVLNIFVKLMRLSIEKNCAYLQVKILEMLNGDELGKIIVNNTRAFKASPSEFPNGENSQVEAVDSLLRIASLTNVDFLKKHGYSVEKTYIKTLYEVIKERQKFLAELSSQR